MVSKELALFLGCIEQFYSRIERIFRGFNSVLLKNVLLALATKPLILEKNLLDKYFPRRVSWFTPNDEEAYVEILMVSNSNQRYTLRVYIAQDFPNSCPEMVLVSPNNLKLRNGSAMPSVSHAYHTIGEKDGCLLLCHFIPTQWTTIITVSSFYQGSFVDWSLWRALGYGKGDGRVLESTKWDVW